nr:type III effector protein [Phaeacidiphilus oryzae]
MEAALPAGDSARALDALQSLRRLREQLTGWEAELIEAARSAGASWADLAPPLGVASRQAAERRYLRLRPGSPGTTREERVRETRDRRAADRAVTAWARDNAADLRQLAGQITAVSELPPATRDALAGALGGDDAADLIGPINSAQEHLTADESDLSDRIDRLTRQTDRLRQDSNDRRRGQPGVQPGS